MDAQPGKYVAVITGDIIGFSDLDPSVRRGMPQVLVDAGRSLCSVFGPIMPGDTDVFRGDGWQALIDNPALALRAALFFRAYIRSVGRDDPVDTRMAIGIGPVDYVPAGNMAAGDGAAYRASGKLLEKMGSVRQGRLRSVFADHPPGGNKWTVSIPDDALPDKKLPDEELIDAVVRLVGTLGDRWRSRSALAITGALKGWSQAGIAEHWPGHISRQAVGKHLERAGWHAIAHALAVFEEKMTGLSRDSAGG